MEEQLTTLENDIETIKRIVNGFIWQNPALENLEVEGICFKSRGRQLITAKAGNAMHEMNAEVEPQTNFCKICFDANNEPYFHCFPTPCP